MAKTPYSDLYPYVVKSQEDAFLFDFFVGELLFAGLTRNEAEGFVATNLGVLKEGSDGCPPWMKRFDWGSFTIREDPYDPSEVPGGVLVV